MIPGLSDLIEQLPASPVAFTQTAFPFPVSQALFGEPPDPARLRQAAADLDASDASAQDAAWIVLAAAEAVESAQPDRDRYFSSDGLRVSRAQRGRLSVSLSVLDGDSLCAAHPASPRGIRYPGVMTLANQEVWPAAARNLPRSLSPGETP